MSDAARAKEDVTIRCGHDAAEEWRALNACYEFLRDSGEAHGGPDGRCGCGRCLVLAAVERSRR